MFLLWPVISFFATRLRTIKSNKNNFSHVFLSSSSCRPDRYAFVLSQSERILSASLVAQAAVKVASLKFCAAWVPCALLVYLSSSVVTLSAENPQEGTSRFERKKRHWLNWQKIKKKNLSCRFDQIISTSHQLHILCHKTKGPSVPRVQTATCV